LQARFLPSVPGVNDRTHPTAATELTAKFCWTPVVHRKFGIWMYHAVTAGSM